VLQCAVLTAVFLVCAVGCSSSAPAEHAAALRENAPPKEAQAAEGETTARRVVHTANLELLVDDFEPARKELLRLVADNKGFVAASETGGSPGVPRSGRWTLRIPVAKYPEFMDAAGHLGEALHVRTDAQDVTEQFVDLDARLKNKRVEEDRLQEHLKASTGKLEEILTVERELARVRGEIEQSQGRLQKLTGLADLATVTVTIRERMGYTAPESPAFRTTIGRTFGDSLDVLTRAGKALVLVAVAAAPWAPVRGMICGGAWLMIRRHNVSTSPPATAASAD
jgi:hypothetical protein